MSGTASAESTARTKGIGLAWLVIAAGLVVTILGGSAAWRAVERLDEAWARYVVVRGQMQDLNAILGARLDEASGTVGLDLGFPTSDEDLQDEFDELFEWAGVDATDIADEVTARERALHDSARDDGIVNERLIVRLDAARQDLDRAVVRPVREDARAQRDTTRTTIVVVTLLSVVLWSCAAIFAWRARRRSPSAHRVA